MKERDYAEETITSTNGILRRSTYSSRFIFRCA